MKDVNDRLALAEQDRFVACEKVIREGHKTFIEVGHALAEIRDSRLYREKFTTFEDYCQERWGFSRQYASTVIGSAKAASRISVKTETLSTNQLTKPAAPNQAQARALSPLSEEGQLEAWEEAVATAPEGKVTAKHVEQVVARKLGDEKPQPKPVKPGTEVFGPKARKEASGLIGKLIRIFDKTPFWPKAKPHLNVITDIIDGKVNP